MSSSQISDSMAKPGDAAQPQSRQKQLWIVLIFTLVAASVFLLKWGIASFFHGSADAPRVASVPVVPGTFAVTAAQMSDLKIMPIGNLPFRNQQVTEGKIAWNGDHTTAVFSPFSGRVTRVIAAPGEKVKAGAPLAAVEASEFVQAQNDLAVAVAQANLARTKETRSAALYDAKGAALQDLQQAQADRAQAQTVLDAVRNRLRIFGKSNAEIKALETGAKMNPVAYIVAPIAGIVSDRQIGPGQFVQAGASNPVFTIGDLRSVWLVANVREVDAPAMSLGQTVDLRVLAFPDRQFHARLTYIAPMVDPATRRVTVRAEISNTDGALKPEMFGTFTIITSGATDAPAIPEQAIIYEADTARVWIVRDVNTLALHPVKVGRSQGGMVEILDGLHSGDKIVTSGSLFIDRAARQE